MLLYLLGEILAFCMPGVFGSCIRSRLMPRNENYPAFLAEVKLPALIADHDLAPICRSSMSQEVTPRGCALWTVDESALHGLRFGIRRAPLSDADGERGERRVMYMDMMYTPLGTLLRVLSAILFLGGDVRLPARDPSAPPDRGRGRRHDPGKRPLLPDDAPSAPGHLLTSHSGSGRSFLFVFLRKTPKIIRADDAQRVSFC